VVWNSCYQDFSRGAEVPRVPVVPWGRHSVSSFFGALLCTTLLMQSRPYASVELMLARCAGQTANVSLAEQGTKRRYCKCRNSVVAQRYLLLDIYNMCMVTV